MESIHASITTPEDDNIWYFTKDQLKNNKNRANGIDSDKELSLRQQTASCIQQIGQILKVSQLGINTAIVYMHRFYHFHNFHTFKRNDVAVVSIFLAAKVEEQPRKLEHVVRASLTVFNPKDTEAQQIDTKSEVYLRRSQDLVSLEFVLIQTLGFNIAISHPHTYVVKCCQLVGATKELAQTSYFMATNSLHLTTMCLEYPPNLVACVCVHIACLWSDWKIPPNSEGMHWFHCIDKTATQQQIEAITEEFLEIYHKTPSKMKNKMATKELRAHHNSNSSSSSNSKSSSSRGPSVSASTSSEPKQRRSVPMSDYKEKKERLKENFTVPPPTVPKLPNFNNNNNNNINQPPIKTEPVNQPISSQKPPSNNSDHVDIVPSRKRPHPDDIEPLPFSKAANRAYYPVPPPLHPEQKQNQSLPPPPYESSVNKNALSEMRIAAQVPPPTTPLPPQQQHYHESKRPRNEISNGHSFHSKKESVVAIPPPSIPPPIPQITIPPPPPMEQPSVLLQQQHHATTLSHQQQQPLLTSSSKEKSSSSSSESKKSSSHHHHHHKEEKESLKIKISRNSFKPHSPATEGLKIRIPIKNLTLKSEKRSERKSKKSSRHHSYRSPKHSN